VGVIVCGFFVSHCCLRFWLEWEGVVLRLLLLMESVFSTRGEDVMDDRAVKAGRLTLASILFDTIFRHTHPHNRIQKDPET